eukprot:1677145-Pyramimonas_sp.AAC.1
MKVKGIAGIAAGLCPGGQNLRRFLWDHNGGAYSQPQVGLAEPLRMAKSDHVEGCRARYGTGAVKRPPKRAPPRKT